MSKKAIKSKLREHASGPVDERLLNYVSGNYNAVAYMGADKLCYAAGCTDRELGEFFAALGVGSMLEFKSLLREIVCRETDGPDDVLERPLRNIADMVIRYEMSNIADFGDSLDYEVVGRLVQDILSAGEVYLVGMRASGPLTSYAAHILSRVGIKVRVLDEAGSQMENLVGLDRGGLVLAFSFSRYHKGTIALLNMLKRNGYNIVSITDYPMSPAAQLSSYSICLPRSSHDYTISLVTGNMLLNILAVQIGTQDKEGLMNNLRRYDEYAQSLEYFL